MYYMLIILLLVCIYIIIDMNRFVISDYIIETDKVKLGNKAFKIIQLSDLHNKKFGKNNIKIVKKINEIKPDIIVMTGDMILGNVKKSNLLNLIKSLDYNYPIFYVFGNHELGLSQEKQTVLKNELKELKVQVLNNNTNKFEVTSKNIEIIGMDNLKTGHEKQCDISFDENKFSIFLIHNPMGYEYYDTLGANLTLSGHLHGGIIRIFGRGLVSPDRKLFPRYTSGEYLGNNGRIIVSRGLGNSSVKLRIFNTPQINVITIVQKKEC